MVGGDDQDGGGSAVRGGGGKSRDGAVTPDLSASDDAAADQVTGSLPDAQPDLLSPPDTTRQCLPGDKRCSGKVVQSCDTTATWQDIVSCPSLCIDGACTGVCTPGDTGCAGAAPQTCDSTGTWTIAPPCPFACNQGACVGRCTPGAHQCTGPVRQLCDGTGQWQDQLTCPFACVAQDCAGVCVPGRTQCLAGANQLCSPAGVWQVSGTSTRELAVNGGFELGETGWTNPGIPIVYPANGNNAGGNPDVAAQTPPDVAWFGGLNNEDDTLTQMIAIPADASALTFSFYYAIITAENSAAELDVFDAQLVTATQTIALAHLGDNNAAASWARVSVPLPAASLAGQTVTLRLHALTNARLITSFYIDTVSLQAVACP